LLVASADCGKTVDNVDARSEVNESASEQGFCYCPRFGIVFHFLIRLKHISSATPTVATLFREKRSLVFV